MSRPGELHPAWRLQPERSNVTLVRLIAWIARHLGRQVARLLLYPICLYFVVSSAGTRRASRDFLARALGRPARFGDVFRQVHTFAAAALDRVFLLNGQEDAFDIRVHAAPEVLEMLAARRGLVVLGAHLGSFEVVRALGRTSGKLSAKMVMYEENARKVNAVLYALNPKLADDVIPLGHADAMLRVEESLERGDLVGLLADRTLAREAQVRRMFLGAPASFPLGPFRIAVLLKRPMILMFGLYRGGNRYDIHFEQLADPGATERADRARLVDEAQLRYVSRLEHYCRSAPYNWFNFFDFWK